MTAFTAGEAAERAPQPPVEKRDLHSTRLIVVDQAANSGFFNDLAAPPSFHYP